MYNKNKITKYLLNRGLFMGLFLFLAILFILAIFCFKVAFSLPSISEPMFVAIDKSMNTYYFILKDNNFIIAKDMKATKIIYQALIKDKNFKFEIQQAYSPAEYESITKDKSVIGRAIVGGLLLGPVGAIVGGMSGIGTKTSKKQVKKEKRDVYAIVNDDIENPYKIMSIQVNQALDFERKFNLLRNNE